MLASVVTHGGTTKTAQAALGELRLAYELFESAAQHGGRAVKFLVRAVHSSRWSTFIETRRVSPSSAGYMTRRMRPMHRASRRHATYSRPARMAGNMTSCRFSAGARARWSRKRTRRSARAPSRVVAPEHLTARQTPRRQGLSLQTPLPPPALVLAPAPAAHPRVHKCSQRICSLLWRAMGARSIRCSLTRCGTSKARWTAKFGT